MSGLVRYPSPLRSNWLRAVARFSESRGFLWGAATNVVTTTIAHLVSPFAQLAHLMIIHLLGAVLISTRFGVAVSTFTAVTGVLAFDYFCIPPIFAFALPDTHSFIVFVGMLIVALTVCTLNQRLRHERALARQSEARTRALCELSLGLSEVTDIGGVVATAERHLEHLFGSEAQVQLSKGPNDVRAMVSREGVDEGSAAVFQPINTERASFGVIRVSLETPGSRRGRVQRVLLAACADRIAVAIERLSLSEEARRAQFEAEAERLRNTLLSAVSHDLKTPLASILTAGTMLLDSPSQDPAQSRELLETIVQETERMNGLVCNLLSVTRLESGTVRLNKTPEALDDLIFGVLSRFSQRLQGRDVEVEVAADLPLVPIDAALVDQALANLIENVLRYTPAGSPLHIHAYQADAEAVLQICDSGPGISDGERERVFEKFYRGRQARPNDGGTGLGLTICRAVARAHGGRIAVSSSKSGGTSVELVLPCPGQPAKVLPELVPATARLAHA